MKIISYNVNGIRAAMNKNFLQWLEAENPDVICLQELKAQTGQFDMLGYASLGYDCYWFSAEKKGYSGVAIFSKKQPDNVVIGCGNKEYDLEGRVITADFGDASIISVYMPSGSSGEERQEFKMEFNHYFLGYIRELLKSRPKLIISGDYNISHEEIDIHDPVRNKKNSGFLPIERAWLTDFIALGFTDSFRFKNPEVQKYSWWSLRFNSRATNKGWRIDYHMVSNNLKDKITSASINNDAFHSDHCPIYLELDLE
ncbi:MAG: exodeoxyribonuclease III [Bacteroidetes bacterium]|nr:exodeoxyribonuclease III [Bacteroidota bacterium]